jgi:RNA polymerase sigma factor (sigma-70 family)
VEELRSLVTRARAGDLAAYGEVVRRFQDMAFGYAYSILSDFHLAEDAAQEAFIQAYRDLGKLDEPAAFPGWFRRIVFKHCDRLRRRKQVATVPLISAGGVASQSPGPAEKAERREMADQVLAAIRSLPDDERTVTTLFYINGYSQKEVAEFLEVPVTTVNNRLHASRKRLRERMVPMVADTLRKNRLPDDFKDRLLVFLFPGTEPTIGITDLPGAQMEVYCCDAQCYFVPLVPQGICAWAFYDWPGGVLTGAYECYVVHYSEPNNAGQVGVRVWSQFHDYGEQGQAEWADRHYVLENDTWRWALISRTGGGQLHVAEDPRPGVAGEPTFRPVPMRLKVGLKWEGFMGGEVVGVSRVAVGQLSWKCQHFKTADASPASYAEWYIAETGRTLFFRRYNGPGYAASGSPRSFESLAGAKEIESHGVAFRHSYDCLSDVALLDPQNARAVL